MAVRRFLRVVTGGGSGGSPATAGMTAPQDDFGFGFDAATTRPRRGDTVIASVAGRRWRVLVGLALPILVLVAMLKLTGSQTGSFRNTPVILETPAPRVSARLASPGSTSDAAGFRSYAIEVTELEGLPPDAAPGTRLEIWVTWEPPVTKTVRVQRLIRAAGLEKIVPPIVPEAPGTAQLSVRAGDIPDLLYGDRFGALSVSVVPDS